MQQCLVPIRPAGWIIQVDAYNLVIDFKRLEALLDHCNTNRHRIVIYNGNLAFERTIDHPFDNRSNRKDTFAGNQITRSSDSIVPGLELKLINLACRRLNADNGTWYCFARFGVHNIKLQQAISKGSSGRNQQRKQQSRRACP